MIDTSKMTAEELDVFRMKDRMVSVLQERGVSADVEDSFAKLIEKGNEIGWSIAQRPAALAMGVQKEDHLGSLVTKLTTQMTFWGTGTSTNITAPNINFVCSSGQEVEVTVASPPGTIIRGFIATINLAAANTALTTLTNSPINVMCFQTSAYTNIQNAADLVPNHFMILSELRNHVAAAAGAAGVQMRGVFHSPLGGSVQGRTLWPKLMREGGNTLRLTFNPGGGSGAVNQFLSQPASALGTNISWQGIAANPAVLFSH